MKASFYSVYCSRCIPELGDLAANPRGVASPVVSDRSPADSSKYSQHRYWSQ